MKRENVTIHSIRKPTSLLTGLFVVLALLSCGTTDSKPAPERTASKPVNATDLPSLKDAWEPYFLVGTAVMFRDLSGARLEAVRKHFNTITPENDMKPQSLQRQKGVFNFNNADRLVNAALDAGLKIHGHVLVWHQQSPEWMNREGISRDEAAENMVTHIKTVAEHYKGKVAAWDVVNEALSDNSRNPANWKGALRQSPWFKALGPDYIEMAFLAAREADPDALLYYNDYNMDNQNKATAVYNMVKEINEKYPNVNGRPLIDGIGMQGHYQLNTYIDNVERSLKRFISLGVEVSITELDIRAGTKYMLPEPLAIDQGIVYARLFAIFQENAANIGKITIWGLDDEYSWRKDENPTLFNPYLAAKPAFYAALDPIAFLTEHKPSVIPLSGAKQADVPYGSPSLDTTDSLWWNAAVIPVNQYLAAWQGSQGNARLLWDEQYLYVSVTVSNAQLNKANPDITEQDSVEIFIDEGNQKGAAYADGSGIYQINFDNEREFIPSSLAAGFESQTDVSNRMYTVLAKIPFKSIKPAENTLIGFDVQINSASAQGIRQSATIWNDTSGDAAQTPSGLGVLRLVK